MIEVRIRDGLLVVQTSWATHSIPLTVEQEAMYETALQEEINGLDSRATSQRAYQRYPNKL